MKNTILALVILSAITIGCKKDDTNPEAKRCYECEISKSVNRNDGMAATLTMSSKSYCDQTASGIKSIESAGTYTRSEIEYTRTVLVTLKTTCK